MSAIDPALTEVQHQHLLGATHELMDALAGKRRLPAAIRTVRAALCELADQEHDDHRYGK